jgi:hypothetical protein
MRSVHALVMRCGVALMALPIGAAPVVGHPAINAFTAHCFKAGQTPAQAHANMADIAGDPLPFELIFWDKTLEPAPDTPDFVERRCEVTFSGNHEDEAARAVQAKMATPPVFGTSIPLTEPYASTYSDVYYSTAYLDARELFRKRVAVVHIGTRAFYPEPGGMVELGPTGTGKKARKSGLSLSDSPLSRHFTFVRVDRLPPGMGLSE